MRMPLESHVEREFAHKVLLETSASYQDRTFLQLSAGSSEHCIFLSPTLSFYRNYIRTIFAFRSDYWYRINSFQLISMRYISYVSDYLKDRNNFRVFLIVRITKTYLVYSKTFLITADLSSSLKVEPVISIVNFLRRAEMTPSI